MSSSAATPAAPVFKPLSAEQLHLMDMQFQGIYVLTAKARPRPRWAPEGTPDPVPEYQVVFGTPTPAQYKMFRAQAQRDDQRATAQETLARQTVVAVVRGSTQTIHDGQRGSRGEVAVREAFSALLDRFPAIPEAAAAGIGDLAGLGRDEQEKA